MFFKKVKKPVIVKKTKIEIAKEIAFRCLFLTIGAFIVAAGLELFLLPNNVIDGGVIGISMMLSYITEWNLGILIFVINLPLI